MLLKVLTIALSYSVLSAQAQACSWPRPDGMTSEWIENDIIFWGRPIKVEWRPEGGVESDYTAETTLEVMEVLHGDLPKKVKVNHSMMAASCGANLSLGDADIYAISMSETGRYVTNAVLEEAVSKVLFHAYFDAGKDYPVQIVDPRYSMRGRAADCKEGGKRKPSDLYCAHESDLKAIEDSYYKKRRNLQYPMLYRETIDETEDLWWRKFWPFD